ncbi:MAG: pyridoxal-phosphate dependent enzyme [Actinomycetota bacterium]
MVDADDVARAAATLAGVARRTPVLSSAALDAEAGARVNLKAESLQHTGSFKFRGAANAVASLTPAERRAGVVTYSSGNHAQALARAAARLGTSAVIVMPHDAPTGKVAATRAAGGRIVGYDRYDEDRAAIAAAIAEREGRALVPPFDHPAVIAGQGTVASELCEEVGPLDVLVVCVGGGGLAAGCAIAAHAVSPATRIVGVEPTAGDDVRRSLAAGHRVSIPVPATIADGQQVTSPGELTFPLLQAHRCEIVTVSDDEIVAAMAFAARDLKLILEPSGASALAALLAGAVDVAGARVGVTLSGGNVDLDRFTALLADVATAGPDGAPGEAGSDEAPDLPV